MDRCQRCGDIGFIGFYTRYNDAGEIVISTQICDNCACETGLMETEVQSEPDSMF